MIEVGATLLFATNMSAPKTARELADFKRYGRLSVSVLKFINAFPGRKELCEFAMSSIGSTKAAWRLSFVIV